MNLALSLDMTRGVCDTKYMTETRTRHYHYCSAATGKNSRQVAPDASCVRTASSIPCGTEVLTAAKVRRFKDGRVRVTWSNGGATWESE